MIYPETFETKLYFHKIREYIRQGCLSPMGKERIDKMTFSNHFSNVELWLRQTHEMLHIEDDGQAMPAEHFFDLREPLKKLKVEGLFLEAHELFDLRRSLGTIRNIVRFIQSKDKELYPSLHELSATVKVYPAVLERIDSIINKKGEVRDNASAELYRIRQEIRHKQKSISGKMQEVLRKARQSGIVDADASVTIRDGRAVIPVNSANKRKIQGIVHDESATGKTAYIEPAEIVEINNEIRELEYAERRELTKILSELSNFLRPYLEEMLHAFNFLGIIDFIRAKARFAKSINAVVPPMRHETSFRWEKAVHPLLYLQHQSSGKPVVPLDIELTQQNRILLISGPNAGGKSVCLQTVGLLQYMLQCGLPVPVGENSQMGFFDRIFMDIGDEQSIENDLSTYSSHLMNMKYFLRHSNNRTLLLIDEFGTGTEPMLGGAIAEAVLAQLNKQKVFGVITTHYTNLKHFASENKGIINGAMLFDTHKIEPLFKLEIGQPGSSFAFEIARKTGLPEEILQSAKNQLGEEHINFDKHLREIIRDKRYWEKKREMVREREKKLEKVLAKYEKELEKLKNERDQIIETARKEAGDLLASANKEIEKTIREIREAQAEKEKTRTIRKNIDQIKEEIKHASIDNDTQKQLEKKIQKIKERQNRKKQKKPDEQVSNKPINDTENTQNEIRQLAPGDPVKLEGQSIPGEIIEINKKEAVVAFGQLITTVKASRLERISKNEFKKAIRQNNVVSSNISEKIRSKKINFSPDIDVRGLRADEAVAKVLEHLDEALLCDIQTVKILHGKGNGILREQIRQHLATLPFVSNFRDEHVQYGGAGITIVELG
ncbi:endonuclease MutS2 [Thermophagus xiamenensis]|uniref:Endonuclease MutS2 n=1 Tax=Thermophagus xiamenensis TaxID=385682 RepID=A0A1I1VK43_9BACT|nr:endonuclease MutS2 [Thermophagus xiamenensis]SFD81413.1 DNA mismatch repair protein MutS2 [Thermophagus xiamenensis]